MTNIQFNLFEVLALIFVAESGTYLIFLLRNRGQNPAFKLLGLLIGVLVLALINLFARQHFATPLPYFYPESVALVVPLFYLYVLVITQKGFQFQRKHYQHFIGAGIILSGRIILWVFWQSNPQRQFEQVVCFPLFIFTYTYLYYTIRQLNLFHRTIRETRSAYDHLNLQWLKYEVFILGVYFLVLGVEAISLLTNLGNVYNIIVLLAFSCLLLFINTLIIKSLNNPITAKGISKEEEQLVKTIPAKYQGSTLANDESEQILKQLRQTMNTEKPYQAYNLTLTELAKMLDISPKILSQVINENTRLNFNDFINQYRVKEAEHLLKSTDLLIKQIMYDTGFQSSSTFNSAFKKLTGLSPSVYRKKHDF